MKPLLIAEIKTQSPFGFKSDKSFYELMQTAIKHGDWISVHTNPLWGGSFEAIEFVRKYTTKPILAKGIHSRDVDLYEAFNRGADYALVVDRVPYPYDQYREKTVWERCLFEIHNMNLFHGNLHIYPEFRNQKFVCNSRDLWSGGPKLADELPVFLKECVWTCQASHIKTPADVKQGVSAFIVGEGLTDFCYKRHEAILLEQTRERVLRRSSTGSQKEAVKAETQRSPGTQQGRQESPA